MVELLEQNIRVLVEDDISKLNVNSFKTRTTVGAWNLL